MNPIVMPIPLALVVIFALGVAAYVYRRLLESTPNPWEGQPWATRKRPHGRHRLSESAEPFRDWAALTAERLNEEHRRRCADADTVPMSTVS